MSEAFDLVSNTIFDNIITNEDDHDNNLTEIWKSDFTRIDIDSFPLNPTYQNFPDISNKSANKDEGQSVNKVVRHDCMWSGTCLDTTHPARKLCFSKLLLPEEAIIDNNGAGMFWMYYIFHFLKFFFTQKLTRKQN